MKVSLSKAYKEQLVSEIIVAALGALYNKASSPTVSPGLYFFINYSAFEHSKDPYWTI